MTDTRSNLLLSIHLYFGAAQDQGTCVLSQAQHALDACYRGLYTIALDNFLLQIMRQAFDGDHRNAMTPVCRQSIAHL